MQRNHTPDQGKNENPTLVYNRNTFLQMMTHLKRQSLLAVDTESDSLYRYYPRVCLIQITTCENPSDTGNGATRAGAPVIDYLVDPLRHDDLAGLGLVLADPTVEKVMHAAENDMLMLQRGFGFTVRNVFDTQLAARILGWKRLGLAAILEEQFGVVSDKRMQRTDWGKRPLTAQQIAYAQMDTHYLLSLRQRLADELKARSRWEEAQEAFAQLSAIRFDEREENERTFWQMRAARDLPADDLGVLASLWAWREQEAQRRNRPPFKILNDDVLVTLTKNRPGDLQTLRTVRGLSAQQANSYGSALLQAITEGASKPSPTPPQPVSRPEQRLDPAGVRRYDRLRTWRTNVAAERGVNTDVILTNETLVEIARREPKTEAALLTIPAIGPWKARTYGPAILEAIRKVKETGADERSNDAER
ncbi:MAG: HRDC domain-containing protein [Caldilineaceae bacterium]|nr:HRDC domain-containing protein [Caldilineaceae bacterium]